MTKSGKRICIGVPPLQNPGGFTPMSVVEDDDDDDEDVVLLPQTRPPASGRAAAPLKTSPLLSHRLWAILARDDRKYADNLPSRDLRGVDHRPSEHTHTDNFSLKVEPTTSAIFLAGREFSTAATYLQFTMQVCFLVRQTVFTFNTELQISAIICRYLQFFYRYH